MDYIKDMATRISTDAALPQIKPAALRTFHTRLAAWYEAHGRHELPWRKTTDGYAIWLSEVMLQQTQVATVLARFYHPFLEKFPTIEALAAAPTESVMKAWEGLGYYSRARNLHKAAQQMAADAKTARRNRAGLPDNVDGLLALPGIGRNTAHAVLAFAHHQPVAIMEANVKRIVTRIFAWEQPTDQQLWSGAALLLNKATPFDYNQAMMDLGSSLCTPKKPACDLCPANSICLGKTTPERYPAPKAKKQTPTRDVLILVQEDAAGKLFLEARDARLLGGLYGFPQHATGSADGAFLGHVTHVYSHFRLEGRVLYTKLAKTMTAANWHSRATIAELPLSTLDHKVLALVDNCNSKKRNKSPARASQRKH